MIDVKFYEQKLNDRLKYLHAQMRAIEDRLDDQPNQDWEENAVEHEEDEVLEDLGNMDQTEVRGINAALVRAKAGTYGICVTCEDEISKQRLDAVPHTPFCKECVSG